MEKYQDEDIVTYYFVINDDGRNSKIQGWSNDKQMVKFYMEFHNCKNFSVRPLTKTFEEITKILDENNNDEIKIYNISVRHPKHKNRSKYVPVPMTATEFAFVNQECKMFMSTMVNYTFIESALPYLRDKYKYDLKMTLLLDVIGSTIHARHSSLIEKIEFDQMMVLLYSFSSNFG